MSCMKRPCIELCKKKKNQPMQPNSSKNIGMKLNTMSIILIFFNPLWSLLWDGLCCETKGARQKKPDNTSLAKVARQKT